MKKILNNFLFLFIVLCAVSMKAQNKYLKFETSTGTPYTSGNGVSTYLYPVGLGTTSFTGTSINPESLRPYGISPNFFLPTAVSQSSVNAWQTTAGSVHRATVQDLYDGNFTTGAQTKAIDDERHVTIDLGQNVTFSSIQVAAIVAANLNGSAVQTSTNGTTWTTVVNATTGVPITSLTGASASALTQVSFYSVTARYVRFMKSTGQVDLSEFRLLPTVSQSTGTVLGTPINLYDNAIAAAATTLATPAGQWIMQDLGCDRTFSSVKLSAATVGNLNGAELQVSTNGTSWTSLTVTNSATGVTGATIAGASAVYPITYTFASQTARYVRVFKSTAAAVETTEFQVGPELAASSATTLAFYGTRTTIDNGTYSDGFTTTATAGITQWAMVNLGASRTFSHIQLGTNATATQLAGSTIQTSTDGVSWTNQLTSIVAPTASTLYTYFFPAAVTAQYVRVIRPAAAQALGISEFIVSPGVSVSSGAKPAIANFSGLYDNAIAAAAITTSAANQFVMLDLGSNKTFANVQIAAGTAVGNLDGAALQVSTDGITWTTLTFTNAATGASGTTFSSSSIVYPITYTFASQTARYIRVFRAATGIVSLGEFRVGSAVFQSSATSLANNAIPSQFNDTSYTTGTLTTTAAGVNQFVGLNLGSTQSFNVVELGPHTAVANLNGATLQVSNDAVTWTTVSSLTDILSGNSAATVTSAVLNTKRTYSFAAQTAQYVRLIKLDGTVLGVSEFRVGSFVSQSSGSSLGTAANLNDNSASAAAVTTSGTNQWVMVDLGSTQSINFVKMATSGAVTSMDGAALQASTDGTTWTTLTTRNIRTGVTGAALSGSSTSLLTLYSFPTTSARYVRVFRAATGIVAVSELQVSTGVFQSSGTTLATTTNLYDNVLTTAAGTTLAGTGTFPAFIGINLGTSKTFSKVEIATTNIAQVNGATLEYSDDFATWTTIIPSISGIIVSQSNTLSFPSVTARYVRIRSNSSIITVTEFKVVENASDVSVRLLAAGLTTGVSPVTTIDFTFNFKGVNYNTFSVSAEGLLRLGTTVVTSEALNNTVSIANNPILFAQWNDLALGNAATRGGVYKTITGTAPNRKMVVEWRAVNGTATGATNLVYQIVLHETTNKIEYIYVTGADNTTDASIGMAVGTVLDVTRLFYSVTPNATLANTTYSNMTPNDKVRLWPGNGTIYSFTPLDLPTTAIVPTDFRNLDNAMGAVNWAGTPNAGGYAVTVNGGHTEKAANAYATTPTGTTWVKVAGLLLQATGTAANPISFTWNGAGAKPIITNGDGVGTIDYIIGLAGSDYVTIDGLSLSDTTAHTSAFTAAQHTAANNLHAEIGVGLFKQRYNATLGNNGCSNVQVKNCTIDLSRWPNGAVVYNYYNGSSYHYGLSKTTWSRGIYATRYTATGLGQAPGYYPMYGYNVSSGIRTQVDVHENCMVTGNAINDCTKGIEWDDSWLKSGTNFFAGTNNIIGATGAGNTITNWGPQPAAANTVAYNYVTTSYSYGSNVAGISISGQKNYTIEHNTITTAVQESGTTTTPATATSLIQNFVGILVGRSGMNQDYPQQAPGFFKKINNNTISDINTTVTTASNTASVYGIVDMAAYSPTIPNTSATNASTGNVDINNNSIFNLRSRSGNVRGISTRMPLYVSSYSYSTLGSPSYEYDYFNTNGDVNVKNNTIKQLAQLGNNTYNNNSLGSVSAILYGASAKNLYIEDNTIGGTGNDGIVVGAANNTTASTNNFINSHGIGLRGILVDRGTTYITPLVVSVKNNTITNLDRVAGTITSYTLQRSAGASAITVYNGAVTNTIENNTITGMDIANGLYANAANTGLDVIYAFGKPKSGNSTMTVRNNSITAITRNQFGFLTSMAAGSGSVAITRGIRADFASGNQNRTINGNTIDGITQTATYTTTAAQQNTFFTRLIGIDATGRDVVSDQTNIFNNTVTNLTGANWNYTGSLATSSYTNPFSVTGIAARSGQFINVHSNRVCGLSTTLTGGTATTYTSYEQGIAGITVGKAGAGAPATKTTLGESIYNNFVSELTAPAISEELAIHGIVYWGSGRFARIAHNTIALGDPAGGASGRLTTTGNTFGVNGLSIVNRYYNTAAYPTIIRNNVISINATAKGSTGATAFSASTTGGFNTAWRTNQSTTKKKPLGIDNSTGGNVYFINDDVRNYVYAQGITTTQSRYYTSGLRNAYGYFKTGAPASYVNTTNNLVNDIVVSGKYFNDQCGKYKSFWGSPERTSYIDIDGANTMLALPFENTGATCEDKLKIVSTANSFVLTAAKLVGAPLNITLDKFGTTRSTTTPTSGAFSSTGTGPASNAIDFVFDPICDGVCEGSKTLTVTLTPPTGKSIPTSLSDTEIPRVYYRRIYNNTAYTSVTTTAVPTTAIVDNNLFYRDGLNNAAGPSGWRFVKPTSVSGADYTFNIDETLFSGSVPANQVVPTYTVEYFVIARTTDGTLTNWSSGDMSFSCPTSVIMNNAVSGTTTVVGPLDDDTTPASGLNIATGAIDGNSVADKFTIYKGADLTRTIKVGNNSTNYDASSTTAYTAAIVNIPICTNEVIELEADYKITATLDELLDECITYKLEVATNVGFTTGLETFTQVNDPKFTYTVTTAGPKFFRFWLDCGGTNAAVTNTQIVQFTATDCPVNTTPVIADINSCVGTPQNITVTTSTNNATKFFWAVNPYGKPYVVAPTASTATATSATLAVNPTNIDESGVWTTYVSNSTGNTVTNAIVKSTDYFDGTDYNTNGGSADNLKGTAFTTTKFIKLNGVSMIGATGDGTATSGYTIKLFAKTGQLLYSAAGPSAADNAVTSSAAFSNWYLAPGDYVLAIDETTVGAGITGSLASVAINGPLNFANTSTPSITIQGGVETVADFDSADAGIANYFVDWDFTEYCTSKTLNRTFNYTINPATCCGVTPASPGVIPNNTDSATGLQAQTCLNIDPDWTYYFDPAAPTRLLFAVNPNGNTWDPKDAQVYNLGDINDAAHLITDGTNSTHIMPYMLRIDNPDTYTVNGGIKVRMYYPPVQKATIDANNSSKEWFTFEGTKQDVLDNSALFTGIAGATTIVPNVTGVHSPTVHFVEFHNVTETKTYGYYGETGPCFVDGTAGAGVDSKVGFTTLDRPDTSWVSSKKNGYLVLESKTKGFVLPRMTATQISAIASPIEGMIVYDTTNNCIKLYNGTSWICTKITCNQ